MNAIELFAGVVAAWFLADFLTGVFHWLEDRYGNPDWPILGRWVVRPNIEHHEHPARMCEGTYLDRNATTIIPAAGLVVLSWSLAWPWFITLAFALLSQGNQIHAWTHGRRPVVVQYLQGAKILISPRDHAKHHRHPFDTNYCTMSPWLNPILSAVRFWPSAEAGLRFIGVRPFTARADQLAGVAT